MLNFDFDRKWLTPLWQQVLDIKLSASLLGVFCDSSYRRVRVLLGSSTTVTQRLAQHLGNNLLIHHHLLHHIIRLDTWCCTQVRHLTSQEVLCRERGHLRVLLLVLRGLGEELLLQVLGKVGELRLGLLGGRFLELRLEKVTFWHVCTPVLPPLQTDFGCLNQLKFAPDR